MPSGTTNFDNTKDAVVGQWRSLSVELRPSEDVSGSSAVEPAFVKRQYTFSADETFRCVLTFYIDADGKSPLMEFETAGHIAWGKPHPVAEGAYEVDLVADESFVITPRSRVALQLLNYDLGKDLEKFEVDTPQDVLQKDYPLLEMKSDKIVTEHDLVYMAHGLLFMGAVHVDGKTQMDKPKHRPRHLQIPMSRVD